MTTSHATLPIVHAQGTPAELGTTVGAALADLIKRFIPMRFAAFEDYASEQGRGSLPALLAAGEASIGFFRRWDPAGYAEHYATAQAAGVDPVDLFCAGNMTDMRDVVLLAGDRPAADSEGCTAALIPPGHSANGEIVCGQTWDLNPQDIDYVVAIHRRPTSGLETWSVTVAGCPSLIGMNAAGVAVGTTNVKTWGARPGVGYLNVLHKMLGQPTTAAAIRVVETAPRSGAHVYFAADSTTAIELEATPTSATRRELLGTPLCRTNHCLDPSHAVLEGDAPTASSRARLARVTTALGRGGVTTATLQTLFGDRRDGIDSVSRYAEDEQGTATNAVFVAVPAHRHLRVCKGPADRGEWLDLPFDAPVWTA